MAVRADALRIVRPARELSASQVFVRMLHSSQLQVVKFEWDESQHPRDERGRFGDGSGSAEVSRAFGAMPLTTHAGGAGAKAWRRANEQLYRSDPEFRAVADAVTFYTQGQYEAIREHSAIADGGVLQPTYKDTWFERNGDEPLSPGIALIKPYFSGQDDVVGGRGSTTYREAGRAINAAIESSDPSTTSLYRGLYGRQAHELAAQLKAGDEFQVRGATSFSRSYEVAEKFSAGMAGGASGNSMGGYRTLVEISPGVRALNVSALSPWKQEESLTKGKFVVESVTVTGDPYRPRGALVHVKVKGIGS